MPDPASVEALVTPLSLDHLVLTVASLDRTLAFYGRLGFARTSFQPPSSSSSSSSDPPPARHALTFGPSKINLHVLPTLFDPKAARPTPGSADLCFVVREDVDLVCERLQAAGVALEEGGEVVRRTGARGAIRSVYVRDPDGNLIECVSARAALVACSPLASSG